MNESKISVRYAKALFQLGEEKNKIQTLSTDMNLVASVCNEMTDFWLMIESPIVKTSQKLNFVDQIFSSKIDKLSFDFLNLIVKNKREKFLKDITRHFLALCRKSEGVKSVLLTTAHELNLQEKDLLISKIENAVDSKIELQEKIDSKLIGGFVLRVEDQQLDASIANQLVKLKRELLLTTSVKK